MSKIAIVTGANQGLGFALAEGLVQRLAPEDVVYITGRDHNRVRAAATGIAGARAARHGGIDVVFSNAAARLRPRTPSAELVGPFVDTNNLGTTRMLRAFDPILRPGGRRWSWPATSAPCAGCPRICTGASTPTR